MNIVTIKNKLGILKKKKCFFILLLYFAMFTIKNLMKLINDTLKIMLYFYLID